MQGGSPPRLTILCDNEYSLVSASGSGGGRLSAGHDDGGRKGGDQQTYDEQLARQWKWLWQQQGLPSSLVGQALPLFSPTEAEEVKEAPGQQDEAHCSGMPLADGDSMSLDDGDGMSLAGGDGMLPTAGPLPSLLEAEELLDGKAILRLPERGAAKLPLVDDGVIPADIDPDRLLVREVSQREGHDCPLPSLVLLPHHLRGHAGDDSAAASTASPQAPWRHSQGAGSSGVGGGGGGSSWSCGPAVRAPAEPLGPGHAFPALLALSSLPTQPSPLNPSAPRSTAGAGSASPSLGPEGRPPPTAVRAGTGRHDAQRQGSNALQ